MIQHKAYKGGDSFGKLVEMAYWMGQNDIPIDATVVYDGCGSHNIAFEWDDGKPETAYEVFVQDLDDDSKCWGWTQDRHPNNFDIESVRLENPGRRLEITWKEVPNE